MPAARAVILFSSILSFPLCPPQHHKRAYIAVGLFRRYSAERVRSSPACTSSPALAVLFTAPRLADASAASGNRLYIHTHTYTLPHTHTHTRTLVAETLLLLDIRSAAAACISLKTTTLIAHRSRETRRAERKRTGRAQ